MTVPKIGDLTKSGLPILVAVSLMISVGLGGITLGRVLESYSKQQSDVIKLAKEVAALQGTLIALRPENQWTRTDQVLFCWEAERINANWRCPAIKAELTRQ
jgi:zona occludens toxin (predicted ATPase)